MGIAIPYMSSSVSARAPVFADENGMLKKMDKVAMNPATGTFSLVNNSWQTNFVNDGLGYMHLQTGITSDQSTALSFDLDRNAILQKPLFISSTTTAPKVVLYDGGNCNVNTYYGLEVAYGTFLLQSNGAFDFYRGGATRAKVASFSNTGTLNSASLTVNRALISDGSKNIVV